MENVMGWIGFIMIVIFTVINLSILHKFVFRIYFGGEAIFREILLAFFIAFFEVGLIVKVFSGVFGVFFAIIKFLLKLILILAVIAVVGFLLSKILPKILPKTGPVITKILLFINEKIHIFEIKPKKTEDENTDTAKEEPVPEGNQNDECNVTDKIVRCSKCGKQLLEGALFCQVCGERVYSEEHVPNAASSK